MKTTHDTKHCLWCTHQVLVLTELEVAVVDRLSKETRGGTDLKV